MEGIEKPHVYKYKEITNDWNYDASCTLTSLPVWDLENFKRLISVVQSVHEFTVLAATGNEKVEWILLQIRFNSWVILPKRT
jgi:hypothetical protein